MRGMTDSASRVVADVPCPLRLLARLRGGYVRAVVEEERLTLERARGRQSIELPVGEIDSLITVGPWFRHRLQIKSDELAVETQIGLWRAGAAAVLEAIQSRSARVAEEVDPVLARAVEYLSSEKYQRHSTMDAVYSGLPQALKRSVGRLVRERLSKAVQPKWDTLYQRSTDTRAFNLAREAANDRFVERMVPKVTQEVEYHLERTPTDEQARAIATDEDATLVLAGAGSGKTMVILGKIAHLIEQGASPTEILVLAFNRKAVEEIRERLPAQLDGVDVETFHSFGLRVVGDAEGRRPPLSRLAENDTHRRNTLQDYLHDMLLDPDCSTDLQAFLLNNLREYASPFDFESMGDYLDYIRRENLVTFNGERVKSFEELEIANFLALNDVKYEYERPYPQDTASSEYRQYQPDFYLPDHDLYIEHFGLDENDQPPVDWGKQACERYLAGVEWKRKIHQLHGTNLIETYSWQRSRGHLSSTLKRLLLKQGVRFSPSPPDALIDRLHQTNIIAPFVELVDSFLAHMKTSRMTMSNLRKRVQALPARRQERAALFVSILENILDRYDRDVRLEGMDFHGMINLAIDYIREDGWQSPYRYVLVDEFQDIALNRMELISALRRPGVAYFAVGDDWQAINRFAGSDLRLMQDAKRYLGHVRERNLLRTFRFGPQLSNVSSAFVKRNPLQSQRDPSPSQDVKELGVFVVAVDNAQRKDADEWRQIREQAIADTLDATIARIRKGDGRQDVTILLLGRYGFNRPRQLASRSQHRIEFSTVHSAKGREADFVIILSLRDEKYGFPAQIADDTLLSLVTPGEEDFEFADERRLFYVALTRARRGVFLLADAVRPSRFVKELLERDDGLIQQIGELMLDRFPECPLCTSGVLNKSKSSKTLQCINRECSGYAVLCECGGGYRLVDHEEQKCTDGTCTATYARCPKCQLGIMLRRENSRDKSEFWSCSEWMLVPGCEWKQNFDPVQYPSYRCPRCEIGIVRAVNGRNGLFWGCNRYFDDPPCKYKKNTPPGSMKSLLSQH